MNISDIDRFLLWIDQGLILDSLISRRTSLLLLCFVNSVNGCGTSLSSVRLFCSLLNGTQFNWWVDYFFTWTDLVRTVRRIFWQWTRLGELQAPLIFPCFCGRFHCSLGSVCRCLLLRILWAALSHLMLESFVFAYTLLVFLFLGWDIITRFNGAQSRLQRLLTRYCLFWREFTRFFKRRDTLSFYHIFAICGNLIIDKDFFSLRVSARALWSTLVRVLHPRLCRLDQIYWAKTCWRAHRASTWVKWGAVPVSLDDFLAKFLFAVLI